ncbi:SIMPL domain-containing protein [Aquabacter sp. L1I39]|nr:SIMPL domain-containing protein [Aquabacter sp. L1I39]
MREALHVPLACARPLAFGLALVGLAAAATLPLGAAQAQEVPRATLTVNGQGEASAVPDVALFTTGVVSSGKTADEALAANSRTMTAVIAAVKEAGIEERDIATSGLSIQPQYTSPGQNSREAPKVVGYEVRNGVSVKVRDMALLGGLLDRLVQAGANQAGGLRFSLSDPAALEKQARLAALKDAQAQAQELAQAAGLRLVRLRRIAPVEAGGAMPAPMMAFKADRAAVPVEAGETTVRAGITLVYDVEPL